MILKTQLQRLIFVVCVVAIFFTLHFTDVVGHGGVTFKELFGGPLKEIPFIMLTYVAVVIVVPLIISIVVPAILSWIKAGK